MEFPPLGPEYSRKQQKAKEKEMDKFMGTISAMMRKYPGNPALNTPWSEKILAEAKEAGRFVLELTDSYLDILIDGGFSQAAGTFVNEAKKFDPEVQLEDILQAIRNVWIANSIQLLLGVEVRHTPSIFAYSMLYPYTDNYMDDTGVAFQDKMELSEKFKRRLAGETVQAANEHERSIFSLVGMIEAQHPRHEYPEVYESLLAIHRAQEESLLQQDRRTSPYETDLMGISFEKGGTSVLADAYLARRRLDAEEARFMYGFGIFLQLADDLQDVMSDLENSHMTLFSQTAEKWQLDNITSRLFNFIFRVLDSDDRFDQQEMKGMKNVIRNNCIFLLLTAIARNSHMFSQEYIQRMEAYSPFSFAYIRRLYRRVGKEFMLLRKNFKEESLETVIITAIAPGI